MDPDTIKYYNNRAMELQRRYDTAPPSYLELFNSIGKKALDIGSGSGRDLNHLLNLGYKAYGVEPSKELLKTSTASYPNLEGRLFQGSLPNNIPKEINSKKWDTLLLIAVLQHIKNKDLKDSIVTISNLLRSNGELLISIPEIYPNIVEQRDEYGRLFVIREKFIYIDLFKQTGLKLVKEIDSRDSIGRDRVKWSTLLLRKCTQ